MVVNDNAGEPDKRGALESIASRPAPTGSRESFLPANACPMSSTARRNLC